MDEIDKRILTLLQNNAKQNTKEIANQIGLTVSPTFERIRKLEQQGYIKNYVAILDGKKVGKSLTVLCQITLIQHAKPLLENFKAKITSYSEVMECHHVSGNFDFLLKVAVDSIDEYYAFAIDKLSSMDGISNVQSAFVLDEIKKTTAYVF